MQMEDILLMYCLKFQQSDNEMITHQWVKGAVGQDALTGRAVTSASPDPPNKLMLSDFQINICKVLIYVLLGAFWVPVFLHLPYTEGFRSWTDS